MINIAIIGMGMIGVSLGMALRSVEPQDSYLGEITVVGYDANAVHTREARGRLAIDREARSVEDAVRGAHIVVVATPVQAIRDVFAQLAAHLPSGVIVTDVSSTKAQVVAWAAELLPPGVDFVGGHPMAGKEQSGPKSADPQLFKEAIYCLTAAANIRQESIDAIHALVKTIGAKPYYIDPVEHDAYVAGISHLPFLLSAALVEVTSRSPAWTEMAPLAASGFRDLSRLASGDPVMHRDICLTNRQGLIRWIDETITLLQHIRTDLEQGDRERIDEFFRHAKAARDEWLESRLQMRPGEADFEHVPQVERPRLFGFRKPSDRDSKRRS